VLEFGFNLNQECSGVGSVAMARPITSLGHQGEKTFLRGPKFYIDSTYENNGYA